MTYQNGKIYKILNIVDDDVYVGSTCQSLSQRMSKHRWSMKTNHHTGMLNDKINEHGIDAFYIELIEDYPCDNKEQLNAREGYHIRLTGTLNNRIAGRTKGQYYADNIDKITQYKKDYRETHSDAIKTWKKNYRETHIDELKEKSKNYRETHKDETAMRQKRYREVNKDTIKEKKHNWHVQNINEIHVKQKQYYETHKEEICEQKKLYRQTHKDKLAVTQKQYRETNKEILNKRFECSVCDGSYLPRHKKTHEQTQKHQQALVSTPAECDKC